MVLFDSMVPSFSNEKPDGLELESQWCFGILLFCFLAGRYGFFGSLVSFIVSELLLVL